MGTVVVLAILAGVVALIVRKMIKDKKNGNPFSAVAIAATAEVIVDTKEQVSYQTTKIRERSY